MATSKAKINTVLGTITDANKNPLANLKIEIYDVDMRSWQPLSDTITDKNGKYELTWNHEQLSGRGKKEADIAVKVSTKEKGTEVYKSDVERIRFNAGEREEINITIGQNVPVERVEFDSLVADVKFLAGKVAIEDIEENKEHRDISFLSKELDVPMKNLEHLVVAHRLQKMSNADASFFYALLRKETLLKDEFAENFQARHAIGIGDDEQRILFDAALTDAKKVETDVKAAVAEMLVSPDTIKKLKQNLKILSRLSKNANTYYEKEHTQKVFELVTKIANPAKIMELQQLFVDNKNNLEEFFGKITDPAFFDNGKKTDENKQEGVLNALFDFSKRAIPNIIKENKVKDRRDVKRLARLNKSMWVEEIRKANPGLKTNEVINTYASGIVRTFERAFPTIAFAAQLERSTQTVLDNQKAIVSFLNAHEDFEMLRDNVDVYLKDNKVPKKDHEEISDELKSVQRIFKLIPHYGKTMALRNAKMHSAFNIVSTGKTRFVNEIAPKAGLSPTEAKEVFLKAETKHTASMLMIGNLNDSMSGMHIASLENVSLAKKIEAVSINFPNLKSLFKLTDSCECEHCRSVYSPAAYLVEILQFLDKRAVAAGNAKSELFKRRPDLGEIDLGCENANTPVKYIDLVCEILEDAITPDPGIAYTGNLTAGADPSKGKISATLLNALTTAGLPVTANALIHETEASMTSPATLPHYLRDKKLVCKIENTGGSNYNIHRLRQTLSPAEELDAAPEYVNEAAYTELRTKNYAFKLPFDLPHTEAGAYFARFGMSRVELMKSFRLPTGPSEEDIATEYLGMTDSERQLIATAPLLNDNAAQQAFWNVPSPGNVVDYLTRVDHFLDRTGLQYKELELLLKLRFIDKNGNAFIYNNDLSCDTEKKEIKNLDLAALDRMHRFLRLQKKTGWKHETIDEVISQAKLGNGNLDDNCLKIFANLKHLSDKTGLKAEELICCYGEIPHNLLPYKTTHLYDSIFQNKAKNGFIEPALSAEEVIINETALIKKQLVAYTAVISTCIGIKETDFDKLAAVLPNGDLSFANLSGLYAMSRLMKKTRIKPDDFFILKDLTASNVFNSTGDTLKFYEAIKEVEKLPMKLADVKFMLRHEATNLADREIKIEKINSILKELQSAYQKSFNINRSPYDDNLTAEAQKETLKVHLSKLSLLNGDDVNILVSFVEREWKYSWIDENFAVHNGTLPADAINFINDKKINTLFDVTQITIALNTLATAAGPNIENEQKGLIKAWLDAISAYRFSVEKPVILNTAMVAAFKSDETTVDIVLKNAKLKKTAPGTDVLLGLLLSDALIDKADITTVPSPPAPNPPHPVPVLPAITELQFPKQFAAIKLLHKLFLLVTSFKLDSIQLEWFLKNNAALGWFELDNIPFVSGQPPVGYQSYQEFSEIIEMLRNLPPVINPNDAEHPTTFFGILSQIITPATTKDELMQALALLTGYEKADLSDIDTHFFAAFSPGNYKSISNLSRLLECAEEMHKLSASVAQINKYIKPVLTVADVTDLRTNLKSRYDEETWLSTLKEIMDKIRPQKRNALVSYLLATNPDVKDENDLFEYFLVDVEMGSCMPSSRIVLAHNSVQLFVQRCLMGLEPNAKADVANDPDWNQWKWMKNYRVWEANRKIFLYPENWYDVTLADDKSFLLTEFINELQQNELTNDTAEQSLRNYLEKLDNIAFLEVKATWYDVPTRTMHVFARTKGGDPEIYYYRRFEKERSWTAWEKVELDITGEQVVAFMRNNRLHLAWLMFSEETKPDQKSRVPATGDQGEEIDPDRPKKKLKIQLAISEFSNKKWQPKRISKDSISTPSDYEAFPYSSLDKGKFNLGYVQVLDQIHLFSSSWNDSDYDNITLNGIFNISGCKGYPEKQWEGNYGWPDFLPDFSQSDLNSQRYFEIKQLTPDDLKVKNGVSPFQFFELLGKTPGQSGSTQGQFRITYPHQMTVLDYLSLAYQIFILLLLRSSAVKYDRQRRGLKIPFGTLLPYFMEDSWHAYVIIPGFYNQEYSGGEFPSVVGLNDDEKRTASNVFQLIDDIINWIKKLWAAFQTTPPPNAQTAIDIIIADPDFQAIIQELSRYKALQPLLQMVIGKTGNSEFEEQLKVLLQKEGLVYGEEFKNMYHPLVCFLRTILYKDGIPGLMKRTTQLQITAFDFKSHYIPNELHIAKLSLKQPDGTITHSFPIEDVDFTSDGSYSLYNWDLFFRVPLHIAGNLTKNQRFEEALTWFHYMFDPTGALPGTDVQKFWVTKPFFLNQGTDYEVQRIDSLMNAVANKSNPHIKELEFAIEEWRKKPFRPDVVARFRPVAYQKALLMKYIDNLTEWGDYLFRQDTMESVAQATQMYILADKLLGPKPRIIPPVAKPPYETYNQIEAKLDSFGNALIAFENILPDLTVLPEGGGELLPPSPTLSMLYFCIPHNEKMFEYWDRAADRLFKIRHCQNIDGIERSLALFAPPIDPGMLVKAAASGLDISSILAGFNAPTPFYRFNVLSQKATELVQEVRGLGGSLLQALEKKDAEALALLRNELEMKVLNATRDIKKLQIEEAKEQIEVLKRTQKVTEERQKYYRNIQKIISKEQLNLNKLEEANNYQTAAQIVRTVAGALRLVPEFHVGASGFGGSPQVVMQLGGSAMSGATSIAADILGILGSVASYEASRASILGGYDRRFDDWKLQERLATKELASIEKQTKAAEIRKEISETDLKNHDLQISNAKKTDEFMRSKFTNKELYDWTIGQISSVYYKSYQLAHDFAKKAERSYRFELGNDDSFVSYGYWDSMKKGLQSADSLLHAIKRMETSYLDKNKREYEITKHVSLLQLDPLALLKLRNTGACDFEIPEVLYDMDHAGHFFRRIKSISISVPCVAGPYTSISAKLSLINNRYRKNTNSDNAANTGYAEDPGNDERFMYNIGSIQSLATSNAQNDSGLFELNFRDDRYLPFEGCGAISWWRLELPNPTIAQQFNYESIADAVIHIKYTAREGGSVLKGLAESSIVERLELIRQQLTSEQGFHIAVNLKHDLPNEWHMLKKNKATNITISRDRLPYMVQGIGNAEIGSIKFIAKSSGPVNAKIEGNSTPVNGALWNGLFTGNKTGLTLDTLFVFSIDSQSELDSLDELLMIVKIQLS